MRYKKIVRGFISVVGYTTTENRKIWISPSRKTIRIDCAAGISEEWKSRGDLVE